MTATLQRGYRLRAYPDRAQARTLAQWVGCRRWAWNWALETRTQAYEEAGETLTSVDLCESIAGHYDERPWLEVVPTCVLQQALRDQDKAFRSWWRGDARRPAFAKRGDVQTARVTLDARHATKRALWGAGVPVFPDIGVLEVRGRAWPEGAMPKMATVSRDGLGRWWLSFSLEEAMPVPAIAPEWACGVDAGTSRWLTLNDGRWLEPPRAWARFEEQMKRLQQRLARQVKGSGRWRRTKRRIARLRARIVDARRDWVHKASRWLVDRFELIGIETLNVRGMTASARGTVEAPGSNVRAKAGLNRAILDACLGALVSATRYKGQWSQRTVVGVDTWFPSSKRCSSCGVKNTQLKLSHRTWQCNGCGTVNDRDVNAAMNIRDEMFRLLGWPAEETQPDHRVRSEPAGRRAMHASGHAVRGVSVNTQWAAGSG
ncbi:MAG: transposase [Gammaproteobacteria bacterium]|nr:transposase [Gammaproteobacteria bacterium]